MALSLVNSFNVGDNATFQIGGASYVTTAVVGGTTYVFVTGKGNGDNGISVFALNTDGTLTNVANVADNSTTNLGGAFALTTAVVDGTTYLFAGGVNDSGVSVFSVANNGTLTNVDNVGDNATLKLALTVDVETMVVGGTTYLFSAGVNDNGVSVFAVAANGKLTNVDNVTDDGTTKIQGPQGMATAVVGGNSYLFVTGFHDNGVGVYAVGTDGHLTNVFNVSDSGPMELGGPVDTITVTVGGTTYLVVSGFGDDGLTVFSVAANGALTNVDNIPDDGTLKLDNPVGLSTTVIGGTTYLFVAGADDDGLSVFAMGADGKLTNVTNVSDDNTLLLDRVIGVTTVTLNGQTYVITGANNDNGVSVFKVIDDTVPEPTIISGDTAGDATEAGAGNGGAPTATGNLDSVVADGADDAWQAVAPGAATANGFGTYAVTADGHWTYTLDNANAAVQALNNGGTLTDTFSVVTADGTAQLVTVTIHGQNDAAVISGFTTGVVIEAGVTGGFFAVGDMQASDVDNANDAWQAVAPGATSANGFGTYELSASGVWAYRPDNANATVQALNDGDTLADSFTAVTADGTTKLVTITIRGQNDAAVITGSSSGSVNEAGTDASSPIVTSDLQSSDVDNTNDAWQAVAAGAATTNGYGTYELAANGVWTYTLDNANAAVEALSDGATLTDTFTAVTADGTTELVTITIHGQNDAATITGDAAGAVNPASQVDTGNLDAADVDNTADAWQAVAAGAATEHGYGTYALAANGVWTYTLDGNNPDVLALKATDMLTDTFTVFTADGTEQVVTVTITGANEAAVITGTAAGSVTEAGSINDGTPTATGNLDSTDVDGVNDAWQAVAPGAATLGGFGTYAVTADGHWTYTLDNGNAAVQALNGAATLIDTFNAVTADGTTQLVTVTIHAQNDAAVISGDAAGAVVAGGNQADSGNLDAADVDNTADAWQAVAAGAATTNGYGTFALAANGVWTYTLDGSNADVLALKATDTLTDTFTVLTQDGTARVVTVTIAGANDAAVITGTAAGNVTEAGAVNNGTPTATGNLDSTDVDNPNDTWSVVAPGTGTIGGFGTYAVTADGHWTYTLDNTNAAVQALNGTATLIDTFNVVTADGTTQLVTVTIHAQNDAATITADAAGAVTRSAGVAATDSGDLNAADPDNATDSWQAVAAGAATANGYGTYQLTAAGVWTYTLDNNNAAVQALKETDTLTDTFTVLTADGTAQVVTVTIRAHNDAPTIDLNGAGAGTGAAITFTEGGAPTPIAGIDAIVSDANDTQLQSATVVLTDAQAGDVLSVGNLPFGIASAIDTSVAGRITVTLNGAASLADYQAALRQIAFSTAGENPATADRHIAVSLDDGEAESNTAIATVSVVGLNDAPVNAVPGAQVIDAGHKLAIAGLAVADPDAGGAVITTSLSVAHGTLKVDVVGGVDVAGSGTSTVTLTGSVAQINAVLAAAGNVVYAPAQGFSGADTLTMTTNDQGHSGNAGPQTDTDLVAITVNKIDDPNAPAIGTPGDDSFTASLGNQRIDAFGGVDTVTFDFRLVDASVSHAGNAVIIEGPNGSHTVLTGVERFVFTDGTVDNHDSDVLVDDLFYYAHNHDVWSAHADADTHYHQFGWHEGRDPSAFFSTSTWLSLNPAVKTSGADPLVQFDQFGWKSGLAPSIAFDVNAYLSANPDVKAAGVDPLAHFLQSGYEEGRQPIAPSVLLAANGFDYVYYLQNNPDVAAAHVDPFLHFETVGWKEGRNPNALFDVNGYLDAYADVKAGGMNPLDHYNTFGWHEGRDPSGAFDTTAYLVANPDVAAANINPLGHFLQNGIHEGRSPFGDGFFH